MRIFLLIAMFLIGCGNPEPKERRCPACEKQPLPTTQTTFPPNRTCSQTTFQELQPVIRAKCVRCHSGFDQYQTATGQIDAFINRVTRDDRTIGKMPPVSAPETLLPSEIQLFQAFKQHGLLERCNQTGSTGAPPVNYSLPEIESAIDRDLSDNPLARDLFRYLVTQSALDTGVAIQAASKVVNSLSLISQLRGVAQIAPGIFRVNLRDFGLSADDWRVIEAADSISFESFTPSGQVIKQLTGTRLPWMHLSNFAFTALQAQVYYQLLKIPQTRDEFLDLNFINVDVVDQLNNDQTNYIGFNQSPISIGKNRIIHRNVTSVNALWLTEDVLNVNEAGKNIFQSPLPPEFNRQTSFVADASEGIYNLPNGLFGFILFNGAGNRVDFAPTDIVTDIEAVVFGLDPQIDAGIDCGRCHYEGLVNAVDEVRAAVVGNQAFNLQDQQAVSILYSAEGQQRLNDDNRFLGQIYAELGITANEDPVTTATDLLRTNYDLTKLAGLAFVTPQQMQFCIQGSGVLQASIGQVIRGGTVSFQQVQASFNDIKNECGLGREFL